MTIASDFYVWLDNDHRTPGTEGRKLHNRIAELEEFHATLRSGFRTVVDEESLLAAKYADLQREHARLQGKYKSALRDIARDAEPVTAESLRSGLHDDVQALDERAKGRKLALGRTFEGGVATREYGLHEKIRGLERQVRAHRETIQGYFETLNAEARQGKANAKNATPSPNTQ